MGQQSLAFASEERDNLRAKMLALFEEGCLAFGEAPETRQPLTKARDLSVLGRAEWEKRLLERRYTRPRILVAISSR